MTYTEKALHGAGMILGMGVLAAVMAYALRVLLARGLGPHAYGLFSSVFTFVMFFLFFRDLGMPQAMIKYIAEFEAKKDLGKISSVLLTVFSFEITGSLLLGGTILISAEKLSTYYFHEPVAAKLLHILALYIVGSVFFTFPKDALLGFQKTTLFAIGDFLKNSAVFLLVFLFLKKGLGVYAPVYAYVIVCFLLFAFYTPFLIRRFPIHKYKLTELNGTTKKVFSFSIMVFATAAGSKIISYIDTLMLTYFRSFGEVGIYNAILPTALMFLYLGKSIASAGFPISSELWAKQDLNRLQKGMELLHKYILVLAVPVLGMVFVFSPFLIRILFGEEYLPGVAAFQVLLLGVLCFIVAIVNNNFISATGKPGVVTKIILIAATGNILLNALLIPHLGILGAAIATTGSYLFSLIASTSYILKQFHFASPWKQWGKITLMGTCFSFFIYILATTFHFSPWIEIIIFPTIAFLGYGFTFTILKIIDLQEIKRYVKLAFEKK